MKRFLATVLTLLWLPAGIVIARVAGDVWAIVYFAVSLAAGIGVLVDSLIRN